MTPRTVLCHFFNEEWLLPFWLMHHRQIFDHGIMIDYHSTDKSVDIIKTLCPTWEIHTSKNKDFSPIEVDREVEGYEKSLQGWRICLNVPEFLIGNYERLPRTSVNQQIFVGQYIIVDMERDDEPSTLNIDLPIYEQRNWGYGIVNDFHKLQSHGSVPRAPRSIHSMSTRYRAAGRHFPTQPPSFNDLAILYYGFGSIEEKSIKRRMQIQDTVPQGSRNKKVCHHIFNERELLARFRLEQQPLSRYLRDEVQPLIDKHVETRIRS